MPDLHSMAEAAYRNGITWPKPPADDDTPDPDAPARPVSQSDEE